MEHKKNHIAVFSKHQPKGFSAGLCLYQSVVHLLFKDRFIGRIFIGLITAVAFFVFVNFVSAAITKVSDVGTNTSTASGPPYTISVTVPAGGVAAGNSIIVTFGMDDVSGTVSCTDSSTLNTYTVDADATNNNNARLVIISAHNVSALSSGDTITVTHPGPTDRAISVAEFSGLASSNTLDQIKTNAGNSANFTTLNTQLTAEAHELLIGAFGVAGPITDTFTKDTDYTALNRAGTSNITLNPEYRIVYFADTHIATGTNSTSRKYAAAIATYRGTPPYLEQLRYRWRNDDGSESTASWAAGEDVKLTGLAKTTPKRLRFLVSNEVDESTGAVAYQLQVAETTDPTGADCGTATYIAVEDTGETHWDIVSTDNITEPESTGNIDPGLTDPGGETFAAGELKDMGDTTGGITLASDEFTEIEFSIQATTSATDAGEYCFRLYDTTFGRTLETYSMYAQVNLVGATAVSLLSFDATGTGSDVKVGWQTAHEVNNLGFYVYRAEAKDGPYARLTDQLIPGADFNTLGKSYEYIDNSATRYKLYYYRLEDVDTAGTRTSHGPVCVDWDGDGLPDDWEIAHGLDPTVNDAWLDADGDGLSNLEEYERGTDPHNADSDGDGVLDGDEYFEYLNQGTRALSRGVHIVSSDDSAVTLELYTESFDTDTLYVAGDEFDKLSINEYVHGYTSAVGHPQLPLKGILVDVPQGKSAHLSVEDVSGTVAYGYRVYPVPDSFAEEDNANWQVSEAFVIDETAYNLDGYYPAEAAELGEVYTHRDQRKQQLVFYPLAFNPVTGQLRHYQRIRVRIDFVDDYQAQTERTSPQPWSPDTHEGLLAKLNTIGQKALSLWSAPLANPPASASFSPLGLLSQALWIPPQLQGSAYKILTDTAGIYRLSGAYLDASGVDVIGESVNQLRLYHLGTEVAIFVYDDNGDTLFDADDYIEFYASQVADEYAKFSRHNIYWLTTAGGQGSPKRMTVIDGTPNGAPGTTVHDFSLHYEPDVGYWQEAPGPDSLDRWFIPVIARGDLIDHAAAGLPVTFDLPLKDVSADGLGTLRISMYGGYDTDHEVSVSYEGQDLGTFAWSGYTDYEVVIDNVDFREQTGDGNYTVSVTCLSGFDKIAFDWIEATYPRAFVAVNDSLSFTHATGYVYSIADFSTAALQAYDVTDPDDVRPIAGVDIPEVAAPYSLSFESAADATAHSYLVVSDANIKTAVAGIAQDTASDLADTDDGADYILITHADIGWDGSGGQQPWIQTLVDLREGQDLRVKVVDVQDIYDEFSYGHVTPQAIKDFLTYAYENWQAPAPQYVLLVGDGAYDFKDNWGLGTIVHVPAYLTYTDYMGETVTDEWFVCVSGEDAVPDMYIGRLPAKTAVEAADMVAKIDAYETLLNSKAWEKNVLLVADDQVEDFEAVFETMNDDAAALLPAGMNADKRYLEDYLDQGFGPGDLSTDILARMEAGTLVVNYSGHGHLYGWTDDSIFEVGHVGTLDTTGRYPFIVSMSCLTGHFGYPEAWAQSFAEVLLREPDKGTAAALMPTGMTTTGGQHVLNTSVFESIFVEDRRALGAVIAQAKQHLLANGDAYFEQVSATFLLFGDPAMGLKVPLPRRPTGLVAAFSESGVVALSWDEAVDSDGNAVDGYHVYRSLSAAGPYTQLTGTAVADVNFSDAQADTVYYYTVTSVDSDGDESVPSAAVSPAKISGGGGGPCFIKGAKASAGAGSGFFVLLLACFAALLIGSGFKVQGTGKKGFRCRVSGVRDDRQLQATSLGYSHHNWFLQH